MKKLFLILIISSRILLPQNQTYFDAPFGGGGGLIPGIHFININDLNSNLTSVSLPTFGDNRIFVTGGGGYIYLGFIPQLRIGGLGYSGTKSLSYSQNKVNYQVDYNLAVGGFTIEYTLPSIKNVAVSLGTILGGGEIAVEYYENRENFYWNNILTPSQKNNYTKIVNDFFLFSPTLNVDIPLHRFLALRVGLGFQVDLGGKWKANNNQTIFNVPDNFNGNSFFIHTGIYFGFFAF
jgi:hypothetical protein